MPMEISPLLRRCLDATIAELTAEFRGVFSRETVTRYIEESFEQIGERPTVPTLLARARTERVHLDRVQHLSAHKTWSIAWQQQPPMGIAALRRIAGPTPAMH